MPVRVIDRRLIRCQNPIQQFIRQDFTLQDSYHFALLLNKAFIGETPRETPFFMQRYCLFEHYLRLFVRVTMKSQQKVFPVSAAILCFDCCDKIKAAWCLTLSQAYSELTGILLPRTDSSQSSGAR